MDDSKRMIIEQMCQKLQFQYSHYIDSGEASKVAELFTEDGVWTSTENTMDGREQILKGFTHRENNAARMSRHVCTTPVVDVISDSEAKGVIYLTLYRHDGEAGRRFSPLVRPEMVGEYRDKFRKTDVGWRISYREIVVNFLNFDPK